MERSPTGTSDVPTCRGGISMKMPRFRRRAVAATVGVLLAVTASSAASAATPPVPAPADKGVRIATGLVKVLPDGSVTLNGKTVANIKTLGHTTGGTPMTFGSPNLVRYSASNPVGGGEDDPGNCALKSSADFYVGGNPIDPGMWEMRLYGKIYNHYWFVKCVATVRVHTQTVFGEIGEVDRPLIAGPLDGYYVNWALNSNDTSELVGLRNLMDFLHQAGWQGWLSDLVTGLRIDYRRTLK
jgi:hypothetical protein